MKQTDTLSFVIPLLDEEGLLQTLHEAITKSAESPSLESGIVFVDDGSAERGSEEV